MHVNISVAMLKVLDSLVKTFVANTSNEQIQQLGHDDGFHVTSGVVNESNADERRVEVTTATLCFCF